MSFEFVSGLVGIYVTNSTRVEERVTYSDFVFPCIFFFDTGTFAQEIIPVLRRKNRALLLTTLYLILTQIRFLIKIDLYYRYLGVDKNPILVYVKFSLVPTLFGHRCFLFIF